MREDLPLKPGCTKFFTIRLLTLFEKKTTNKNSVHRTDAIEDLKIQVSDGVKSILQKLIEKTDLDVLRSRLGEIGEDCRQMLSRWAEGYSDKEIAQALNYKTADVAKTSRMRCLEKLRRLYKQ